MAIGDRHSHGMYCLKSRGNDEQKAQILGVAKHLLSPRCFRNLYIWDPFLINPSSPGGAAPVRLLQLRLWPQRTRPRRWIHQQNHHERYPKRPKLPKRWRLGCLAVSQMTLCFEWSLGLLFGGWKIHPKMDPETVTVQALGEDAIAAGRRLYVEGAVVPRSGGSAIERLREGLEGYTDIPNSFDLGNVYMVFTWLYIHLSYRGVPNI